MSNLRDLANHITYIPFYIPEDHPNYLRKNDEFINEAWDCLKNINKKLKKSDLIASHCSRDIDLHSQYVELIIKIICLSKNLSQDCLQ